MKALHRLTWIFILVLVYSPVEGAPQPMGQASATDTLTIGSATPTPMPSQTVVRTPKRTLTATRPVMSSPTPKPIRTATFAHTATLTSTLSPTTTETFTPTPVVPTLPPGASYTPWPDAPLCPDTGLNHDTDVFHTLWDALRGCHYDHEHGESPFPANVQAAFLDFDLKALLGNVEIGHTNPSGPMENTHKHGGFKWQVDTTAPNGCALGFEGAEVAVNAYAIQYHSFGNYEMEFQARIHSIAALLRQSVPGSSDYGYVYVVQHADYGQRVAGYQGDIMPFPDNSSPSYPSGLAPYFTMDCIGRPTPPCGRYTTYAEYVAANGNTSTTWTSKSPHRVGGSPLLMILFRARDIYQVYNWQTGDFLWMCSNDEGTTYRASGCRHNNTTTRVHEVGGTIPSSWDNLAGFDTDLRAGRITAEGYVTHFGQVNQTCTAPGPDCHPIKMIGAYVGRYGSLLIPDKVPAFSWDSLPERDIYFCGATQGRVCSETSVGAVSSGWIGSDN